MPQICLYLHIHQPYRLKEFALEELGHEKGYFAAESDLNREVFDKIAHKSYYPMLKLINKLLKKEPNFKISFSITGVWLEQAQLFEPSLLDLLRSILASGRAEILAETYHHTLASLYSPTEFTKQVDEHMRLIKSLFGVVPTSFRNTELVYSNDVGRQVAAMGFKGILTEGVDRVLQGRTLTQAYYSVGPEQLPILLKHAQLSDDVAFRFSNREWQWYPLTVERYLDWVEIYGEKELVNLFMDFETFGEHQWDDTGIFSFFEHFVKEFSRKEWNTFVTPAEVFELLPFKPIISHDPLAVEQTIQSDKPTNGVKPSANKTPIAPPELRYDVPIPISWADVGRDLTAWLENAFQQDCIEQLYALEAGVLVSEDMRLITDWRRLQTSDHFYYMCTKWSADGDVHAYFSPYRDPFEAYRRYSIVLADIKHRLWSRQNAQVLSSVLVSPHLSSTASP